MTDRQTDRPTDRRTDRRTLQHIDLLAEVKITSNISIYISWQDIFTCSNAQKTVHWEDNKLPKSQTKRAQKTNLFQHIYKSNDTKQNMNSIFKRQM